MAVTQNSYTQSNAGTTTFAFTFPYLKTSEIKAQIDATVTTAFTLPSATTVQFNTAPAVGAKIKIYRETDDSSLTATFYAGSSIKAQDLNDNFTQNLYTTQEVNNRFLSNLGGTMVGNLTLDEDADIVFEGATANAHETTLTVADPTADRTITLPNETGTVITSAGTDVIDSAHYVAGSIDLEHMSANSVDSDQYVDGSIDLVHMSANSVDSDQYVDGSIDSAHIANDQIDSQHYAAGSIDLEHMSANSVDSDQYVDGSIDLAHMSANSVDSDQYVDGSIDRVHLAADIVDGTKIADDSIDSEHYVDGSIDTAHLAADAVTGAKIADNAIDSEHYTDGSIDTAHIGGSQVTDAKLASNSVTTSKITDSNVTTVKVADSNITLAKLASDLKQTSISDSDTQLPTSGAVVDYVAAQIAPIGGLEVIADDESFPNTIPSAGVVISITDAAGLQINSSGVSTNGDTLDNSTVTINGFPSSLRGGVGSNADPYVLGAGAGLMVQSTGSSQTYNYHKALLKESDFVQLSDDINDFNSKYRIASSAPGSNNDEGDLYFNTSTNKMYVYDGSAWGEVTSTGDYKYLTIKDHDQAVGGSGPTFNGSNEEFDLFDGSSDASITTAAQLLVVLNGIIQKPNTGTFSGSEEGFYLNDTHGIKFCDPPASGSSLFVTQLGTATTVNVPADGSVTTAKLGSGAVTTAMIADDAINGTKLADNAVDSEHYTDGSIDTAHIAADAVTGAKIADDAIGAEHIEPLDAALVFAAGAAARVGVADKTSAGNGGHFLVTAGSAHGSGNTAGDLLLATSRGTSSGPTGEIKFGYNDGANGAGLDATWAVFDNTGKLGLGETDPEQLLHLKSTGSSTDLRFESPSADFIIQSGNAGDDGFHIYDNANSLYRMTIDTTGAVGIGTITPTYKLDIIESTAADGTMRLQGGEGSDAVFRMVSDDGDDNADYWRLSAYHTANAFTIETFSDGSWDKVFRGVDRTAELYYQDSVRLATTSGGVTVTGSVTETSDIALKTNIEPINNVLDKIQQITGYTYQFKDTGHNSMGVTAQDVEKVFPELVHGEEGAKTLQYSGLIGALIESVKELSNKVAALEAK